MARPVLDAPLPSGAPDPGAAATPAVAGRRLVVLVRSLGEGIGGAERVAVDLLLGLDGTRYDRVLCIVDNADDPATRDLTQFIREAGVRVVGLGRRSKRDLRAWSRLFRLLVRERPDILHSHAFGPNVSAVVLGRMARVPTIIAHEHGWPFTGRWWRPAVDRNIVARGADALLVVSQAERAKTMEIERVPGEVIQVLPNAIDELPPGDGAAARRSLGLLPDQPVVGIVCVLRPEKALEVFVEAMALLAQDVAGLRAIIVGDGDERPGLEALIERLGVQETVLLAGIRRDVPDVLAATDVAVLCSDREGSPLAVLEYMDAGRPIVATRVGGIPELVEDREHALLVPPRDAEALAGAVAELLRDRRLAEQLAERARERRRTRFTKPAVLGQLNALYDDLSAAAPVRKRGDR